MVYSVYINPDTQLNISESAKNIHKNNIPINDENYFDMCVLYRILYRINMNVTFK